MTGGDAVGARNDGGFALEASDSRRELAPTFKPGPCVLFGAPMLDESSSRAVLPSDFLLAVLKSRCHWPALTDASLV